MFLLRLTGVHVGIRRNVGVGVGVIHGLDVVDRDKAFGFSKAMSARENGVGAWVNCVQDE